MVLFLIGVFNFTYVTTFQVLVEPVLNLSNRAAYQGPRHLTDGGPLLTDSLLHLEEKFILFARPGTPDN